MNLRRDFLKFGAGAVGAATMLSPLSKAFAASCGLTPKQAEGPFYPGEDEFQGDTDLTRIPGHAQRAEGQVVIVHGRVTDVQCRPVKGVSVEIWQACHSGKYNNSLDPNPAPLDPHFRYWAETLTDDNGEYSFKTILPGAYPADTDWVRPPHIHFKVQKVGFHELTTQLYFKGNAFNDQDLILRGIPVSERSRVVVEFLPSSTEIGALEGSFDITLRSVRV